MSIWLISRWEWYNIDLMSIQRGQNLISNQFSGQLRLPRNLSEVLWGHLKLISTFLDLQFMVSEAFFPRFRFKASQTANWVDLFSRRGLELAWIALNLPQSAACFSFMVKTIIKSALYSFPCVHIDPRDTTCGLFWTYTGISALNLPPVYIGWIPWILNFNYWSSNLPFSVRNHNKGEFRDFSRP